MSDRDATNAGNAGNAGGAGNVGSATDAGNVGDVVAAPSTTTLAFDLGGTKLAAALVCEARIIERTTCPTRREAGPGGWVDDMARLAQAWRCRFGGVGVALTGLVCAGRWSALNRATLDIDDGYPLVETLEARLGARVHALNDAQAAAWGEYRFGAGRGRDLVFVTVSTGIGGGIVSGGRLLRGRGGLAGHVGQVPVERVAADRAPMPFEDGAGGRWIEAAAARAGHVVEAREVFAAAADGAPWAEAIVARSARRTARLCETLQAVLDPHLIVVGGGIGLADGYLDRVARALAPCHAALHPTLVRAALGADSGLLGAADLARRSRDDVSKEDR